MPTATSSDWPGSVRVWMPPTETQTIQTDLLLLCPDLERKMLDQMGAVNRADEGDRFRPLSTVMSEIYERHLADPREEQEDD